MNRLERILQAIKGKGEELKDVGVNVGEHLGLEHLGLDPWKCVIFRRLVCFLLFIY